MPAPISYVPGLGRGAVYSPTDFQCFKLFRTISDIGPVLKPSHEFGSFVPCFLTCLSEAKARRGGARNGPRLVPKSSGPFAPHETDDEEADKSH